MTFKRIFSVPGIALLLIMSIGAWAISKTDAGWEMIACWLLCCSPFLYLLLKK